MNAVLQPVEARFVPMTVAHLDTVIALEHAAYPHPWTRGNFIDSMAAGYQVLLLMGGDEVLGYFVAMKGVDEAHLLNITVASLHQRSGWARMLLDALNLWARQQGLQWIWLEVRVSNLRAQNVYLAHGYRTVGERKHYYPAHNGLREDAVVMNLQL